MVRVQVSFLDGTSLLVVLPDTAVVADLRRKVLEERPSATYQLMSFVSSETDEKLLNVRCLADLGTNLHVMCVVTKSMSMTVKAQATGELNVPILGKNQDSQTLRNWRWPLML